jgi:hypothetical protein
MGKIATFPTTGWKSTNVTIRAYVDNDQTGTHILAAAVSAISYTVTESLGPNQGTQITTGNLTPVASYLSDTLSTTGWTVDTVGYNFQATLPAACFPDAGEYVIDLIFTLAGDSSTFPVKLYHHARSRS